MEKVLSRRLARPRVLLLVSLLVPLALCGCQCAQDHSYTSNDTFTIHTAAETIGPERLPAYAETSGAAAKILLTPLAVVGDATVLAFILALQAAITPSNWTR